MSKSGPVLGFNVPPYFVLMLVFAEDRWFFHHHGFVYKAMFSAFKHNLHSKEKIGASTITQQLMKNKYLSMEQTYSRKVKEAFLTVKAEASRSKVDMLQEYMDIIEYGEGAWGITDAAMHYYGKKPQDLNLVESMQLIAILPWPEKNSPRANPQAAANCVRGLAARAFRDGLFTEEEVISVLKCAEDPSSFSNDGCAFVSTSASVLEDVVRGCKVYFPLTQELLDARAGNLERLESIKLDLQ